MLLFRVLFCAASLRPVSAPVQIFKSPAAPLVYIIARLPVLSWFMTALASGIVDNNAAVNLVLAARIGPRISYTCAILLYRSVLQNNLSNTGIDGACHL